MDVLWVRLLNGTRNLLGSLGSEVSFPNEFDHEVKASAHMNIPLLASSSQSLFVGHASPLALICHEEADCIWNREPQRFIHSLCEYLGLDRYDGDSQLFALSGRQSIDLFECCLHDMNGSEMQHTTSQDVWIRFDVVDEDIRVGE